MKVLLVDADAGMRALTADALRRHGYVVLTASDGADALARWQTAHPDLVLLEVTLPKVTGFEVCQQIRQASSTPVIMLTARRDEADVVRGLQVGADDYVTKPFSTEQLVARMQAVLQRAQRDRRSQLPSEIRVNDWVCDTATHTAINGGTLLFLTRTEFRLLDMLAANAGRVVPYSRLIEYAWGYADEYHPTLLKSHISRLRRKLGQRAGGAGAPGPIRNMVGVGYVLSQGGTRPAAPPTAGPSDRSRETRATA